MTTYRVCLCFRRKFKLGSAEPPAEIKEAFDTYAENGVMGVEKLQTFLMEYQGQENATREDAQAILDSLREFKHLNIFLKKGLNLEAFFRYLFGEHNSPLSPSVSMFGMSKVVAERNSSLNEVESSLPLQTMVSEK